MEMGIRIEELKARIPWTNSYKCRKLIDKISTVEGTWERVDTDLIRHSTRKDLNGQPSCPIHVFGQIYGLKGMCSGMSFHYLTDRIENKYASESTLQYLVLAADNCTWCINDCFIKRLRVYMIDKLINKA